MKNEDLKNRLEEISDKAESKKFKAVKHFYESKEVVLISQMTNLVSRTLTDTTFNGAISNVGITEIGLDYACLEDMIQDYEFDDIPAITVYVKFNYNDDKDAQINCWVGASDDVAIRNGDLQICINDEVVETSLYKTTTAIGEILTLLNQ